MISSLRRGLRPNRRQSTQRHRPCSLRWTGRKPTGMCACPLSRRLLLHTCAGHQPTLQTIQDDSPSSQQGLLLGWAPPHAMAVLQVFQAKLLQSLEGGTASPEEVNDLPRTSRWWWQRLAEPIGFMVVQQRHLWLTLADLKDSDRKVLLNAPITPSGLFGSYRPGYLHRLGCSEFSAVQAG